jgi:hypothetical protein
MNKTEVYEKTREFVKVCGSGPEWAARFLRLYEACEQVNRCDAECKGQTYLMLDDTGCLYFETFEPSFKLEVKEAA